MPGAGFLNATLQEQETRAPRTLSLWQGSYTMSPGISLSQEATRAQTQMEARGKDTGANPAGQPRGNLSTENNDNVSTN